MSNIVKLGNFKNAPLVEMLDHLRNQVENDALESFAWVGFIHHKEHTDPSGELIPDHLCLDGGWANVNDGVRMVGALEGLKFDLMHVHGDFDFGEGDA